MKNWLKLLKNIWSQYSRWILLAIVIRLLLMPFFTHSDLLSEYRRAYILLQRGELVPASIHHLHAWFLLLMKPFLSGINIPWQATDVTSYTFNNWFNFVSNPYIFRVLFLFKLPYLFFDGLAFLGLAKIMENNVFERQSLLFWLFNPILIFSTYIFGRYDIIIIFLIIIALLSFKKQKSYISVGIIAIASVVRYYPILLLAAFLLMTKTEKRIKVSIFSISALAILGITSTFFEKSYKAAKIAGTIVTDYPFFLRFKILGDDIIFIFVMFLALLLIYIYFNIRPSFENLIKSSLAILMVLFAFSYFHPHYFVWTVPFVALLVNDKKIITLFWIQTAFWAIFALKWGKALTSHLLMPLSPLFFKYMPILNSSKNLDFITALARSIFTAIAIAIIFLLMNQSKEKGEKIATG